MGKDTYKCIDNDCGCLPSIHPVELPHWMYVLIFDKERNVKLLESGCHILVYGDEESHRWKEFIYQMRAHGYKDNEPITNEVYINRMKELKERAKRELERRMKASVKP